MAAQERRRPPVAPRLGRRLIPGTLLLAVLLSAPLFYAEQWVAAVIFGIAPLAWLGWVTLKVSRVEKRSREAFSSLEPIEPVVVVGDDQRTEVYLRMEAALANMEAVDVRDGVYRLFRPDGELYELWITADGRAMATPSGRFDRPGLLAALHRAGHLRTGETGPEDAVWRVAQDESAGG